MIFTKFGNVFDSPRSYSLAHCISSDGHMGKGIAVQFVSNFPTICALRGTRLSVGAAVPVFDQGRFIYNLVTKRRYWMKPSLSSLFSSLSSMFLHAEQNGVADISLPKIGSGCDKLIFELDVLPQLKQLFSTSNINIHIFWYSEVHPMPRYVTYICDRSDHSDRFVV